MSAGIVPDGFALVAVKNFDELMYWLERSDTKGHLERCSDLVDPWAAFDYREIDASLIAEAGTVTNETGLTPRQLADRIAALEVRNAELLSALQSCVTHGSMTGDEWVSDKAYSAINKTTGEGA